MNDGNGKLTLGAKCDKCSIFKLFRIFCRDKVIIEIALDNFKYHSKLFS